MERNSAQDQAQGYRCQDVFDGVFHGVAFIVGLHLAALPQLSGYAQKIILGFTLCFDNENPNGFSYSTIRLCPLSP